jgi:hypothetical protein
MPFKLSAVLSIAAAVLNNRLIQKPRAVVDMNSAVVRNERLGGVLNYYERRAA